MLSAQEIHDYHKNGYVVLPGFKSKDEIERLKERALEIALEHDFKRHKSVFSTGQQRQKNATEFQEYFIKSANSVECFFEEKAFDAAGQLTQPLAQSLNKIGHALHDLDPVFDEFSRDQKLAKLARALGLSAPQIWQSMYIFKQPRIGGAVDWHQDASFFQTKPTSVTTFWFALDDATLENGCLWVEPGGHYGPLRQIFVRTGDSTDLRTIDKTPWPTCETAIPVEVDAGSLVCFHGHLPHYSAANTSNQARHAYTLHVTDGQARYLADNWIQRSKDFPVRGFETPMKATP